MHTRTCKPARASHSITHTSSSIKFDCALLHRWSPAWGEAGYIRLKRDPLDATPCGVDNTPLDGTGCSGGPPVQYPCGQCGVVFDVSYPTGAFAGR